MIRKLFQVTPPPPLRSSLRLERDLKADQDAATDFEQSNNLAILLRKEGTIWRGATGKTETQTF